MVVTISVCQGPSCTGLGSAKLACDLEDLCAGNKNCQVEWGTCLDHCGKGPNLKVQAGNKNGKIIEGVENFKKIESLLKSDASFKLDKMQREIGEIKFLARRDKNAQKRSSLIEKAFVQAGGEMNIVKKNVQLATELLVMRSRENVNAGGVVSAASDSFGEIALQDAKLAISLNPKNARGYVAEAFAQERLGRWQEALESLKSAAEMAAFGYGIDRKDVAVVEKKINATKKSAEKEEQEKVEKARLEAEARQNEEEAQKLAAKKKAEAEARKRVASKKKTQEIKETKEKAEAAEAAARKAKKEEEAAAKIEDVTAAEGGQENGEIAVAQESEKVPFIICPPLRERLVSL